MGAIDMENVVNKAFNINLAPRHEKVLGAVSRKILYWRNSSTQSSVKQGQGFMALINYDAFY